MTLLHERYKLLDTRPEHVSATCFVFKAMEEQDMDESSQTRLVALKFMRIKAQFVREVRAREKQSKADHMVSITRTLPSFEQLSSWPAVIEASSGSDEMQ